MTSKPAALALTRPACLAAVVALTGCGASVQVDHWQTGSFDIAGARDVVVTDAYGRGDSVDAIADLAVSRLRDEPWFDSVVDATRHDRLESDGVDAWLRHGELERGTLYVRLDVLEDIAVVDSDERVVDNGDGTVSVFVDEVVSAHTLLSVTLGDEFGVIVDELDYEGVHEIAGPVYDSTIDEAMHAAATAAIDAVVVDLAPTRARVSVPLDERDEAVMARVRPVIDSHGVLSTERRAVADSLATVSGPSAAYNRAVLTEAAGDLVGAVELYRAAAAMPGAFAEAARVAEEAIWRLQDARALGLAR